ncbi:TonB-dependent receptor [Marivibrio halodurans]|nr:TonB-dependent receptor [Marivibrio halodurans]
MHRKALLAAGCAVMALTGMPQGSKAAEPMKLDPVIVEGGNSHSSQRLRRDVEAGMNANRTNSYIDGSVLQNINPVNSGDALRYNVPGLINQPFNGDRFGGGQKIRTFGDFGAAQSIDGMPAFQMQGQEGGGYSNTLIPTIAIDQIGVMKGSRGVGYGDGTDGGVIDTTIKSGRDYTDHQAVSLDLNTAREALTQVEAADHSGKWDYYAAGSFLYGDYNGDPDILEQQSVKGGLGKVGYNFSDDTRFEFLGIYDRSDPRIYRNNAINQITTSTFYGAATLDHQYDENNSGRVGVIFEEGDSAWPGRNRDRGISNQILFGKHYLSRQLTDGVSYDGSIGGEVRKTNSTRDEMWDNTFVDYAAISENAFHIGDNLIVNGGLRVTKFNNEIVLNGVEQPDNLAEDTVFSYEGGASYDLPTQTQIRASYATGYNRFFNKYGNFGTDALNPAGAGDEIVESRTIEAGVNQGWNGGYVDLAIYNVVQDNVPRRNGGAIESIEVDQSGIEMEFFHRLTEDLAASASYMHILDVQATRANGQEMNSNIFWAGQTASVPKDQMSIRLDYALTQEVDIWGMAFYSTGYEEVDANGNTTEREDYNRIDLGAAWAPVEDWSFRFRAENITDERGFGQAVQGTYVDTDGNLGRVFWVGVDHTF